MSTKTLEARVKALEQYVLEMEHHRNTVAIAHRITTALLAKGNQFDLRLVAKLNILLGVDVMPLRKKATKAVHKAKQRMTKQLAR